jgi:DNA-binding transcriptional LysR family regulator
LGVQLFLRHHAEGLSLTPAGRALMREAKLLLKQAEGLYSAAADLTQQLRGELGVGWFSTLAPLMMPEIVHAFLKAYPATRIRSFESHQQELLQSLRRADIEVAITYDLELSDDIAFAPLASLPPYALFGASHPFARARSVKLAELASEPMVLLDLPVSREYFRSLFSRERLEPQIAWASTQQEAVRSMVASGLGYALANVRPRSNLALDGRRLYPVPLAGEPAPVRIGIATLRQLEQTRLVEAFERHCRALISETRIPGMMPPLQRRRAARR